MSLQPPFGTMSKESLMSKRQLHRRLQVQMSVVQGKLRTLERLRTCYLNQTLDSRNYQFIHSNFEDSQADTIHDEDGYTIDNEQIYSQRPPSPESPPISFQVHRPFKYSRPTGTGVAARQVPLSDTRITAGMPGSPSSGDEYDESNAVRSARGRKRASTDPHSRASDLAPLSTITPNPRDKQPSSRGTSTVNSSDLSDEDDSEMDEELHRAALQIKFSKMPARRRTNGEGSSSSSSSRRDSTTSKLSLKMPPLPTLPELSSGTNHQNIQSPARLSRRHSESSFLQPGNSVSLPAIDPEQPKKAAFSRRDTNSSTTSTDIFDGQSYGSSTLINKSSMDSLRAESDLSRNSNVRPTSDSRAYLYNGNFNGSRISEPEQPDPDTSFPDDRLAGDSTATEDVDTTENGEYDANAAGYDTTSTEEEGTMATIATSLLNEESSLLSRKHVSTISNSVSAEEDSISYRSGRVSPDFSAKPFKLNAQTSALSSLIQADRSGSSNPLDEYAVYAGSGTASSLCLKIYFPNSSRPTKPLTVILRSSVTVAEGIGYMLYLYQRENVEPTLTKEHCNPNSWNLQIVEEDGVPDEDFPALERTRRLSAFSFDEFALVEATPAQANENEKVTPTRSKSTGLDVKAHASGQSAPGINGGKVGESSRIINVLLFSSDDTVSSVKVAVNPETRLDDILSEVCQTTNLNRNDYILRIPGSRYTASGDTPVKALEGKSELELCPISFVGGMIIRRPKPDTPQQAVDGSPGNDKTVSRGSTSQIQTVIQGAKSSSSRDFSGRRVPTEEPTEQPRPLLPEAISRATYRKYQVWRRQPMSFINRHERILAIDGEYVHIMPSGDRTWFESPKTTSFHIGAIINCKQSRKVPTHFKIVISKGRESKRYDLDAISRSQAGEIVGHLRKYAVAYRNDIRNNRQSQIPV